MSHSPDPACAGDVAQLHGKALIDATRAFAREDGARSARLVGSTFGILIALELVAASPAPWPVRLAASVLAGLTTARGFIVYHDFLHGAILRGSRLARALLHGFGLLLLTPPRVWRETHNYHHAHTAKIVGSHVGSYAMVTTGIWAKMGRRERLVYRAIRHPLTMLLGYFTIFMYGMCISPLRRAPRKHLDAAMALLLAFALNGVLLWKLGVAFWLYVYFLPLNLALSFGAYLFYAQHNFPGVFVQSREDWSYTRAALESSSYLRMGRVMAWFTGNIGYHHVHHLNQGIPFYRLPEAMAALVELQHPTTTTLSPRDVVASFRLKLWDVEQGRMVGYPR